jgi:hypothetical protein
VKFHLPEYSALDLDYLMDLIIKASGISREWLEEQNCQKALGITFCGIGSHLTITDEKDF